MTFKTLRDWSRFLHRDFDKPERIGALWKIRHHMDERVFWSLFGSCWTHSENLFQDLSIIEKVMRDYPAKYRGLMMDRTERQQMAALPDLVTVFRGCCALNQNGWSWTLNYDKAVWFAKRLPMDGKPLVVTAAIYKKDVMAFFGGRNESEIVIDPLFLTNVKVKKRLPKQKPDSSALLYLDIHSGALDLMNRDEVIEARAKFTKMTTNGDPAAFERAYTVLGEQAQRFIQYGFLEKAKQIMHQIEIWKKVYSE